MATRADAQKLKQEFHLLYECNAPMWIAKIVELTESHAST
jgi:hypothetical protein